MDCGHAGHPSDVDECGQTGEVLLPGDEWDALGRQRAPRMTKKAAFTDVYQDHAGFVWRVLRGIGVPDANVEDALQEVFIVVHRRLAEFDGRSVKSWLFEIARRIAHDHRRALHRKPAHMPLSDGIRDEGLGPLESAERAEGLRLLEELLDGLGEDKRLVLLLTDVAGMTAPEIAEAMGTNLSTVYTRLRRAREEFNAAVARTRRS
jgi:RNA polymerase sigma-70 factor (ECF subfamily)